MKGALAALAALVVLLGGATAAGGSTPRHGPIAGVVPHAGSRTAFAPSFSKLARSPRSASFTFAATYQNLINQYFTDVAAASASNAVDNVYSVDTQYYSDPPHVNIQYVHSSTFGGSFVSHDPLPPNGCDDTFDNGTAVVSDPACLTDQQLAAEIQHVLTVNGWHGGLGNMFFLMTPDGVGSCFDGTPASSGGDCSTNSFCAYHSDFVNLNNEEVIYANEPSESPVDGCTNRHTQGFPNDPSADTTINTISHEHNEAITDPLGDAWWSEDVLPNTDENGDLCAYQFGTPIGGTPGVDSYNQAINGHHYELQEEFSNADMTTGAHNGCIQRNGQTTSDSTLTEPGGFKHSGPLVYHGGPVMHTNTTYAIYWAPTPGNAVQPTVTGTVAVNHTLTTTAGTWTGGATSFAYQWQRCSSAGRGCVNISGATASTYTLTSEDGGNTVRSTVSATNVNGASPYAQSATTAVVAPVPAATGGPVVSGAAGVGKSLSTTSGTWNTSVSFTYQWLRCAADGTGCAAIPAATANTYPLVGADAGHRLEAVVSGTNAAGTASATSAATSVIVSVPRATRGPGISVQATTAGKLLKGSPGTWSGPPQTYRYAWLRCSAHGSRCTPIEKAIYATYRPRNQDAGHRLRLRVTAVNAAGEKTATSKPSGLVHR